MSCEVEFTVGYKAGPIFSGKIAARLRYVSASMQHASRLAHHDVRGRCDRANIRQRAADDINGAGRLDRALGRIADGQLATLGDHKISGIEGELSVDLDISAIGPEVAAGLGEITQHVEQTPRGEVDVGAERGRPDGHLRTIEYIAGPAGIDRALRRVANGQVAAVGDRKI